MLLETLWYSPLQGGAKNFNVLHQRTRLPSSHRLTVHDPSRLVASRIIAALDLEQIVACAEPAAQQLVDLPLECRERRVVGVVRAPFVAKGEQLPVSLLRLRHGVVGFGSGLRVLHQKRHQRGFGGRSGHVEIDQIATIEARQVVGGNRRWAALTSRLRGAPRLQAVRACLENHVVVPQRPDVGARGVVDRCRQPLACVYGNFYGNDRIAPGKSRPIGNDRACWHVAERRENQGVRLIGRFLGPTLLVPVSRVRLVNEVDAGNPFRVLHAVTARHEQPRRKPVFLRKLDPVHEPNEPRRFLQIRHRNRSAVAFHAPEHQFDRARAGRDANCIEHFRQWKPRPDGIGDGQIPRSSTNAFQGMLFLAGREIYQGGIVDAGNLGAAVHDRESPSGGIHRRITATARDVEIFIGSNGAERRHRRLRPGGYVRVLLRLLRV